MNIKAIDAAVDAAQRFITSAAAAKKTVRTFSGEESPISYIPGGKETGDLRRKSMDLTRALAEMRRPNA